MRLHRFFDVFSLPTAMTPVFAKGQSPSFDNFSKFKGRDYVNLLQLSKLRSNLFTGVGWGGGGGGGDYV